MSEREQAAFLWQWSRRRGRGRLGIALFGLGFGAVAGLVFALLMLWAMTYDGGSFSLNEEEMGPFLRWLGGLLGPTAFLFVVSIPPFALLGAFLADRVWGLLEARYQAMLSSGARVPHAKPIFTLRERVPGIVVLGLFVLLALGLLFGVWWEVTRGSL